MTPNFLWKLFTTFLHEIKSPYLKLKKSVNVKYPSVGVGFAHTDEMEVNSVVGPIWAGGESFLFLVQ